MSFISELSRLFLPKPPTKKLSQIELMARSFRNMRKEQIMNFLADEGCLCAECRRVWGIDND